MSQPSEPRNIVCNWCGEEFPRDLPSFADPLEPKLLICEKCYRQHIEIEEGNSD
jgi:hypothetical protein